MTIKQLRHLLLVALTASVAAQADLGRLEIAPDDRHFQYEDGTPFFYLGDTAWSLFHRLDREEATRYLEDRAEKGFTVIQAVGLAELNGLTDPNAYGDLPLVDMNPAQPNEAYFKHVDFIVDKAEALGMHVGFLPTWGKHWKSGDDQIFTEDSAEAYGEFLGERYKDKPIIWILGGDQNVVTEEERDIINAMAKGLSEGDDGRHLITYHPRGPGQSSAQVHEAKWLDFHMFQSSHAARHHDTGLSVEHPGARQMGYLRRFMEENDFQNLLPDQSLIENGPLRGPAKIRAMRARDNSRLIVYTPQGEGFTLDQSQLKAVRSRQYWYDPRYGVSYVFRVSPRDRDNQTFQTYTPPTSGRGQDWVLVIEKIPVP